VRTSTRDYAAIRKEFEYVAVSLRAGWAPNADGEGDGDGPACQSSRLASGGFGGKHRSEYLAGHHLPPDLLIVEVATSPPGW
jgi:hypothetical protein